MDKCGGEVSGEINGNVNCDDFSENELLIYDFFVANPSATRTDLIKALNISSRTIDRAVKSLKEKNAIERVGSDKTGYWKTKK